jgi:hypothetical protein
VICIEWTSVAYLIACGLIGILSAMISERQRGK